MKKLLVLLVLGLFFINPGKAQLSYQTSDLPQTDQIGADHNQYLNNDLLNLGDNNMLYKRRRGGGGDLNIGGRVGINLANIAQNFKEEDYETKTKMHLSFALGVVADIPITEGLFIQPGLMFSNKGYSDDLGDLDSDSTGANFSQKITHDGYSRTNLSYIEIPINVVYKTEIIQFYAGPYIAFGMGGKSKWDYDKSTKITVGGTVVLDTTITESGDGKIKFKGSPSDKDLEDEDVVGFVSPLDFGLSAGVGVKLGPVVINAGYSLGLGNMAVNYDYQDYDKADWKTSNRVITVSVTYFFMDN